MTNTFFKKAVAILTKVAIIVALTAIFIALLAFENNFCAAATALVLISVITYF